MKVALIETAVATAPGSMRRYADLVALAFDGHPDVQISRVSLASSERWLKSLPRRVRSWGHHAAVAWNARKLRSREFDLFHIVDGSHGYVASLLSKERTIATVHDVIPYLQQQGRFPVSPPGFLARMVIWRALDGLKSCRALLIDSECSQRDLIAADIAGMAQVVCPLTLEPRTFFPSDSQSDVPLARPQILHVGNNGFYKNRRGVVEIFARVRNEMNAELVMVGPAPLPSLQQRVRELNMQADIRFVIDPSDEDLCQWYRQASLLLFPSVYEGFGWPPLEAMASGCPVVCSHEGSLPEVVGDAALLGPANDEDSLANGCLRLLRNESLRTEFRNRGLARAAEFGIDRFRQAIEAVYRQVAGMGATGVPEGHCSAECLS